VGGKGEETKKRKTKKERKEKKREGDRHGYIYTHTHIHTGDTALNTNPKLIPPEYHMQYKDSRISNQY
jgi:hypothetical protein